MTHGGGTFYEQNCSATDTFEFCSLWSSDLLIGNRATRGPLHHRSLDLETGFASFNPDIAVTIRNKHQLSQADSP